MSTTAIAFGPLGDLAGPIHRLDARAKLIGLLTVTGVALSTPIGLWPVWIACAGVLVAVAAAARLPAAQLWRRARLVLPLVALVAVFVPFVRTGGGAHALGPLTVHDAGLAVFATTTAKALIGTFAAVVLGATTPFPAVLRGLEAMRAPRLLVLIAAFMYRYLGVITADVASMRAGLASRGYRPRTPLQAAPLGRAATALFLRTYGRGERIHLAMLARGYSGRMPEAAPLVLGRADVAFVAAVVLALVPLRVLAGVPA
jgi:cobalt/nickel transport system permease protein